ncbi:energy transducer TonB [Brenneria goodwinii]|uniref:Protein TonB n=1 Tax=Brenneria goodwinii TaxID=1109412 RepID=A0AAE8EM68_9GAMM|nr:energy transducer TonB [Brenneria goodwinii]RLM20204.1 energy transducer TonB [Brenneria goodwinii]
MWVKAVRIYREVVVKAQHLILKERIEVPESAAPAILLPTGLAAVKKDRLPRLAITAVALAHLALIGAAITHTTQYRPLDIINPAEQTSVQVTMVEMPQPEPPPQPQAATETPALLTAENSEREVAQSEPAPPMPAPAAPPIQPKPKPKPKPTPKIEPKPKPVREAPRPVSEEKSSPVQNARVADKTAIPATAKGEMLKSAPNATPKMVSTVGCMVPAPDYPRKAKRLREEGEVLIRLTINANGTLGRSEVARSSGHEDLDQAAMAAVSGIRCNPYLENGQPISVMTVQPVTFKLSR